MTRVERSIELSHDVGAVWAVVGDVPRAAGCLPGLELGAALDARSFRAALRVTVGLLVVRYSGTLSVGDVDPQRRSVRFRVDGIAAGGFTLSVATAVAAAPRAGGTSRLTIVNDIALDLATALLAGPMTATLGGTLLDGFARNFGRLLDRGAGTPPAGTVPPRA